MSTTQQPEALAELRERLRGLETDHTPDGWPAVRMRDITALLDDLDNARSDNQVLRLGYAAARLEIESLQSQLHAAKQINAAQFGLLAASIPGSVPQGKGWVVLPGQLPEPGKPVLLDIGKTYPIRALWAAKHTLEMGADAPDEFGEYDEATDAYYCPEGWYEWNQHEETHWAVSETPRAWCELPLKDTQ